MSQVAVRARIRQLRAALGRRLVVLDDDPTGSQSVHGVPVVTAWGPQELGWAFAHPAGAVFILTNTRSLEPAAAAARVNEVAAAVERAARTAGLAVDLVSRGDSTLRGHYPLETDLLAERAAALGHPVDVLLIVPAYPEVGRITVDDVHLARRGNDFVPVAETDYARDASFGYTTSNLRDWVAEKTGGRVPAEAVGSVRLRDVREGGPERVAEILQAGHGGLPIVVNAESTADLDTVALGVAQAEQAGVRILVRCAPTFVAALLGLERPGPLHPSELPRARDGNGLVVVGSHVELTTLQLCELRRSRPDLAVVELDVERLLAGEDVAQQEVASATAALTAALAGGTTVVSTSRRRVTGSDEAASLVVAAMVSKALVEVVRRTVAARPPAWVIAKGGITSSDIATDALQITRAEVVGQLFDGYVSVWANRGSGPLAGMPYVVFAGNVGDAETLAAAVELLDSRRGA
jgi:uncharacterized protein YgbK (DUF1537 family)